MTPGPPSADRLHRHGRPWAVAASALLLALGVRWPELTRGFTADEVSNTLAQGLGALWRDAETGINPPLYRWLVQLLAADGREILTGRLVSWISGGLAAGLVTAAAGRCGKTSGQSAVLAGLLVAFHPQAVAASTEYRAYGVLSLAVVAQGMLLADWIGRPDGPRTTRLAAATLLLPWIHYMTVPILAAQAILLTATHGPRAVARWTLPAAVAFAPLALRVLGDTSRRTPPGEPVGAVVGKLLAVGLTPSLSYADPAFRVWKALTDAPFHWPTWMAGSVLVAAGIGLAATRPWGLRPVHTDEDRHRLTTATFLVSWAGLIVGAGIIATRQNVRDPLQGVVVCLLAPWLAGLVGWIDRRWLRRLAGLALAAWIGPSLPGLAAHVAEQRAIPDAWRLAAARLRDAPDAWGTTLSLWPGYEAVTVDYTLHGEVTHARARSEACRDVPSCFEVRPGVRVVGVPAALADRIDTVLLTTEAVPGLDCPAIEAHGRLRILDCRPTTAPETPGGPHEAPPSPDR